MQLNFDHAESFTDATKIFVIQQNRKIQTVQKFENIHRSCDTKRLSHVAKIIRLQSTTLCRAIFMRVACCGRII